MNNFQVYVAKTQHGKTFVSIKNIEMDIEDDDIEGQSLHIVLTMNSLCNTDQFTKRFSDKYGDKSICVLASKKIGNFEMICGKDALDKLIGKCSRKSECPKILVMCTNPKQLSTINEFIDWLNTSENTLIKRISIHCDEIHRYIELRDWRNNLERITKLPITTRAIGYTATPLAVWKKGGFWENIHIFETDVYNNENYAGISDIKWIENDLQINPKNHSEYIENIITLHPDILSENTRTFIPAYTRIFTHDKIRDLIFKTCPSAIICTINGSIKQIEWFTNIEKNEKHIQQIDLKSEPGEHNNELCEEIADILNEHKINSRPFIITGYLCVQMGQTLTSSNYGNFTSAIFAHTNLDNDNAYQLFGRVTGRMKHWDNYEKTKVYCPTTFKNIVTKMEILATNTAENLKGQNISQDDYLEPVVNDPSIMGNFKSIPKIKKTTSSAHIEIFESFEDAKLFSIKLGMKTGFNSKEKHRKEDGFIYDNGSNLKGKLYSLQEIRSNSAWHCLGNETKARLAVCYEDITDTNTEKYVVAY